MQNLTIADNWFTDNYRTYVVELSDGSVAYIPTPEFTGGEEVSEDGTYQVIDVETAYIDADGIKDFDGIETYVLSEAIDSMPEADVVKIAVEWIGKDQNTVWEVTGKEKAHFVKYRTVRVPALNYNHLNHALQSWAEVTKIERLETPQKMLGQPAAVLVA